MVPAAADGTAAAVDCRCVDMEPGALGLVAAGETALVAASDCTALVCSEKSAVVEPAEHIEAGEEVALQQVAVEAEEGPSVRVVRAVVRAVVREVVRGLSTLQRLPSVWPAEPSIR